MLCADIKVVETMEAYFNQETFLSNEKNKAQFITLLSQYLEADGQTTIVSSGDADTMIVSCALQIASNGTEVKVVADDTDVLILLMYHRTESMANVYFMSEPKKSQKKCLPIWKISDLVLKAGKLLISHSCLDWL